MDRTISLVALIPALIAITPATAQAVGTVGTTPVALAAPADKGSVEIAEAPKPRTVRIAGRTVDVESLPASSDARDAPEPTKPKTRPRR